MSGEYISHYDLIIIAKLTALCSNTSFSQEIHNLRNVGLVLWKRQQVLPSANGQKTLVPILRRPSLKKKSQENTKRQVSPLSSRQICQKEGQQKEDSENQYRFKKENQILYAEMLRAVGLPEHLVKQPV